jgi:tetratricopeptide (TPR) repeat protein
MPESDFDPILDGDLESAPPVSASEDLSAGGAEEHVPARSAAVRPRRESAFADPVVRLLTGVLVVVVLLFLSTIVAGLFLGVIGDEAPRTSRERDLLMGKYETDAGSTDPEVWKQYIGALVDSGRYDEAQQAVDRGMQVIDNRPGADMTFAQTQVYYSSKQYAKAIDAATDGMAALTAYHEAQLNVDGSPEQKGQPISETYWGMLYLRAMSHVALEDWDAALEDLNTYLETKAGASDVYVVRAEVHRELGDKGAAEADYRRALTHIPDYQPAIDGLEELGVQR